MNASFSFLFSSFICKSQSKRLPASKCKCQFFHRNWNHRFKNNFHKHFDYLWISAPQVTWRREDNGELTLKDNSGTKQLSKFTSRNLQYKIYVGSTFPFCLHIIHSYIVQWWGAEADQTIAQWNGKLFMHCIQWQVYLLQFKISKSIVFFTFISVFRFGVVIYLA